MNTFSINLASKANNAIAAATLQAILADRGTVEVTVTDENGALVQRATVVGAGLWTSGMLVLTGAKALKPNHFITVTF